MTYWLNSAKMINTWYTHPWKKILWRQWWDTLHFHMFCCFSPEMFVNLFFTGPCTKILHDCHCLSPFGCYFSSWTGDTYILNIEDKSISNVCHTVTVTVFLNRKRWFCRAPTCSCSPSTGDRGYSTKQLCSWLFTCKIWWTAWYCKWYVSKPKEKSLRITLIAIICLAEEINNSLKASGCNV